MTRNFFNDFIRGLFSSIDYFVYSSIEWVTQGIFDIAELRTNVELVESVRDKIYVILGIFMLFKISASLIQYMVNPDMMVDKEKGATKLVSRTIVMLVMLLALPTAFSLIYRAQTAFLPMIPKLLLNKTGDEITQTVSTTSNDMAVTLLQAFFHPYYSEDPNQHYASIDGSTEILSLSEFVQKVNVGNGTSVPILGTVSGYSYEYRFLLSTVVGVVVLFLLIGITIDLSIRLFKMLILEMIAPIPIMSFVDPKSQKDGAFISWFKELGKTFIDIFVKLGLIYLVLFFVSELKTNTLFENYGNAEGLDISPVRLMYLRVFIIIGLLLFAKQAPKFIRKILGLKEDKEGSFLGNLASGIAGFGAGAVSGAISGRGLRGAITGGLSGASAGYQGAASGKGANAWQAGGDAAIQARLGDKNAKSGILASLQAGASRAQMKQQASRLNLTKDNIDKAKANWLAAQAAATEAEWGYRDLISQGPRTGESQADYEARRQSAYSDWQDKVSIAGDKERNYTKGKDAYEKTYGQEETAYARYANGSVHRATKAATDAASQGATYVHDAVSTAAGGRTIQQKRDDRTSRVADHGGFNPDK